MLTGCEKVNESRNAQHFRPMHEELSLKSRGRIVDSNDLRA